VTLIQQNRYDQLLRRVCDLKGPGSKVVDSLSELFPVIDVERVPGELLLLGGTSLCQGAAIVTGAVGERPRIQIFNPVGSGKLVTVTTVYVSTTSGSNTVRWAINQTALTTGVGTEVFRDGRLRVGSRPTAQIRTDSTVAITDANGIFQILNNTPEIVEDSNGVAVLPPGSGLEFGTADAAEQIIITFLWRERVAEPSELGF